MKPLAFFSNPFFWLVLYLLLLVGIGSVYLTTLGNQDSLYLVRAIGKPNPDGGISVSVTGEGLENLPAYLTLDTSNRRAIVGNIPISGQAFDISIVKDKAFVVSQNDGVNVFDLSNPIDPVLEKKLSPDDGWRSDASDKNFFLSRYLNGLSVYPVFGGGPPYRISGPSLSSIHRGNKLFIAKGSDGLSIYEFFERSTNFDRSRLLAELPLSGSTVDLAFIGNFLVAASRAGGLHLVDISDLVNPLLKQTISDQRTYERVWMVGDILYASSYEQELSLFRLTEGRLVFAGGLSLVGKVRDFVLDGERLYLAEDSFGVSALDVSDPEHPRRTGVVGTQGQPFGLALYGDYLYVASSSQGVMIVDTRRFGPLNLLASIDTSGSAQDFILDGRWIYVADGSGGLQVIDRSDENNLKLVASLPTLHDAKMLAKSGNLLFVALFRHGLICIDVSDPLAPRFVSQIRRDVSLTDMVIHGKYLYAASFSSELLKLGSYNSELLKFDISDPEAIRVIDSIRLPEKSRKIILAGENILIAAEDAGLLVANFPEDQPGRLIGNLTRPWPMSKFSMISGVTVHGHYAYLIHGEDGLQIVDISNPSKPEAAGFLPLPALGLSIGQSDSFVVVATRWDGYFFIDVSSPEKPRVVANIYLPLGSRKFELEEDRLYVAGQSRGIEVVPLPIKNIKSSKDEKIFTRPEYPGWYDLSVGEGKQLVTAPSVFKVE